MIISPYIFGRVVGSMLGLVLGEVFGLGFGLGLVLVDSTVVITSTFFFYCELLSKTLHIG